jgi:hypothetical protein
MQVRAFEDNDLEAVLALRAEVFEARDLDRERARWTWEYEQNPGRDPATPCSWILEQEGRIIGNYGMLPWRMLLDGEPVQALCGIDFCIEKGNQGMGLGLLLTRRFLETAGCQLPFVTSPTPPATALMRYFGATVLEGQQEPCLWVVTASSWRPGECGDSSLSLEQPAQFDARFEECFRRVARHYRMLTLRDLGFLQWRYVEYPFGKPSVFAVGSAESLRGFCVLQEDPELSRGYLLELVVEPGDAAAVGSLLSAVQECAAKRGLQETYLLHRDPRNHAALQASGFSVVEHHPLTFLAKLPDEVEAKDWYLSSGDGDLLFNIGGLAS